jgi:hypothetical protein
MYKVVILIIGRPRLLSVFDHISPFSGFSWFVGLRRFGLLDRAAFPRVVPLLLWGGCGPASFPV